MSGLAVGDGGMEGAEGTTAQLDWLLERMNESHVFDVGKALEDLVPVIARSDIAGLTVEDIAKLSSLDRSHHKKVLTVDADALHGGDDVVGMHVVDLGSNHDALEEIEVCDGLLALVEG